MLHLRLPFLLLLLLVPFTLLAGPYNAEIERIANRGTGQQAHWGVYAVRVSNGQVVADVQGDKLFMPASTRKLVTTALMSRHLGADKVFTTSAHAGEDFSGGRVDGGLVIVATGDPTWTPALRGGRSGVAILDQLASQIADAGVRVIDGGIIIDASRYEQPQFMPPGWEWEDFQTTDGAIPSAFGINRNLAGVSISPGGVGQPVNVSFPGRVEPFELVNRTTTGRNDSAPTFTLNRGLDGTVLVAEGSLAANAGNASRSMPLGRPVEFAAGILRNSLEDRGVEVRGDIQVSTSRVSRGQQLAMVTSAPIADLMRQINQPSDNQLAESGYLLVGAEVFGRGSYNSAQEAERRYWNRIGVDAGLYRPADGSGLSRHNWIAPKALVELLRDMRGDSLFVDSLPVSGRSGTMRYRLSGDGMAGRVRAKTGTLTGAVALAGYVTTNGGDTVVFAIIVNNNTASASAMRSRIDEIVTVLAR